MGDFPGSPVAGAPSFYCRGRVLSLVGELRSQSTAKNKPTDGIRGKIDALVVCSYNPLLFLCVCSFNKYILTSEEPGIILGTWS